MKKRTAPDHENRLELWKEHALSINDSKRIFVTGSRGYIGKHLIQNLKVAYPQFTILGLDIKPTEQSSVNSELEIDLVTADLREVFNQHQPNVVFHLAAQTDVRKSLELPEIDYLNNVTATERLLEQCLNYSVEHFIFSNSGGAIFGNTLGVPHTENSEYKPMSPYGENKIRAAALIKEASKDSSMRHTIFNLSNVYGSESIPKSAPSIFLNHNKRKEQIIINGSGLASRDWIHVEDVLEAFVFGCNNPSSGSFNISTGVETTIHDLTKEIESITGLPFKIDYRKSIDGEVKTSCLDPSKAFLHLGWKPKHSLIEGLKLTLNEMKLSV